MNNKFEIENIGSWLDIYQEIGAKMAPTSFLYWHLVFGFGIGGQITQ